MSFKTLDNVVRNVLVSLEESSLNRYQTYLQFAIRGFKELNLHNSTVAKIAYLPILDNKAVDLPSDYVKYVKIGVVINGRIVMLGLDDSLALNKEFSECGDPLQIAMDTPADDDLIDWPLGYGYFFGGHFRNGQYVGAAYGIGGGYNSLGYFRVNEAQGQIQLTSNVPTTEIVLEYISNGMSADGTASIPEETVECLLAYVHWKRLEYKKGATANEIDRAFRMYVMEYNKLKHFKLFFTVTEYLASYRTSVHGSVKR